jgi:hypothetical protein
MAIGQGSGQLVQALQQKGAIAAAAGIQQAGIEEKGSGRQETDKQSGRQEQGPRGRSSPFA